MTIPKIAALRALLAISCAALPLTAFAAPPTHLNLGSLGADVAQLDPHFAANTTDRTIVAWIYNGLVRFKPGTTDPAQIEPDLAESWTVSDDKLVWTFKLRPGVKWQKGYGEVTADDVVFSLKKAATKETSAFSPDYAAFDKVEALDPLTVQITLKRPIPSLLGVVANYAGGFIVPKKAVEEKGADFTRDPVGSGPFEVDAITSGQSITFKANEAYFRGAPQIKTVTFRFLPQNASRDLAFTSGEIDAAAGVQNKNWVERARQTAGASVDVFDPAEESILYLNKTKPPLDDIKVRQAIAHAINRAQMVTFQGADFTKAGESVIPSNNLGFTADNGLQGYDLAAAKKLVEESGHGAITLPMVNSQLAQLDNIGQVIQAQLKAAGIGVEIQPVEHATYHQMIRQDLSALVIYGAARFPVADFYLSQFFYGPSAIGQPTAVTNFSHCAVADEEIAAARVETDPEKQIALWQEAQRKIIADVCAVPLVETQLVWIRKNALDWGYDLKGSMSLGPLLTETTHFTE